MKKIITLVLVIFMTISLTACDKTPTTTGENNNQNNNPVEENKKTEDLTTVEGYMEAFGITLEDMKCANFTRVGKTSYDLDSGKIIEIGSFISKPMTDEEVKAWIEKIIAKLDSLSDDGKIMTYGDGELTVDYIMSKSMKVASGYYQYKGKKVAMSISVFKGELDNSDPNEAMPACSLGLEFRK